MDNTVSNTGTMDHPESLTLGHHHHFLDTFCHTGSNQSAGMSACCTTLVATSSRHNLFHHVSHEQISVSPAATTSLTHQTSQANTVLVCLHAAQHTTHIQHNQNCHQSVFTQCCRENLTGRMQFNTSLQPTMSNHSTDMYVHYNKYSAHFHVGFQREKMVHML